ncbi:discoidin domain-containing protein [Nocardioides lacusdianchii]|uniref:discoidin domain-containing protein n=1 Tax=Nocardioides lacusdianchii TaxID=2783664 RepID=UPI001CCBD25E|nr:discoidin domain-containing protein [Nocardioides lacusdianchii]
MDSCVACGAELGVGRFCLNCGHPIGAPAPTPAAPAPAPAEAEQPAEVPVQAADPTPVPPTGPVEPPPSGPAPSEPPPADVRPARSRTWDPRDDLLPYEEVDDFAADDPVRGWAWAVWVAFAVALVVLVVVLIRVFGTDGDVTASDPDTDPSSASAAVEEDPSAPASDVPRGVGKRLDLAESATFGVPATAPATTDFDGTLVAYEASQMADGNPATTWRTAGDATGEQVVITLAEPGVVTRVGLVNGYAKQVAGVDWYPNNRRILAVTWTFEDGTEVEQTFAERPAMQLMKVPPVETSTVTVTITSVTPPGSGNLGRDYTAISEVSVIGRRAG